MVLSVWWALQLAAWAPTLDEWLFAREWYGASIYCEREDAPCQVLDFGPHVVFMDIAGTALSGTAAK